MTITLKSPLDMHLHLRDEEMLKIVKPLSTKIFCAGIIMLILFHQSLQLKFLKLISKELKKQLVMKSLSQ